MSAPERLLAHALTVQLPGNMEVRAYRTTEGIVLSFAFESDPRFPLSPRTFVVPVEQAGELADALRALADLQEG